MVGTFPAVPFKIGAESFSQNYYLVDGIYPQESHLLSTFAGAHFKWEIHFAALQEGLRKDVERAFGMIQQRWHRCRGESLHWYIEDLKEYLLACIILHNMVIFSPFCRNFFFVAFYEMGLNS